jgi:hypothetical protein
MFKYNVFISHASEDKDLIARPIADALSRYGLRVWFDELTLSLGDSLTRSIDMGLAASEYGVVILSPAFFAKNWPEYEFRGLVAKEMRGKKVILPIWHKVDIDEVIQDSPTLADKIAVNTGHKTVDEIALEVIGIIRPDLLTKIHNRIAYLQSSTAIQSIPLEKIYLTPLKHKELPPSLIGRIRLIRAALLGVYTHSMKFWIDGFRGDAHPSREIAWWEHIASCYLEYIRMTDLGSAEQHKTVFSILISLRMGEPEEKFLDELSLLPEGAFAVLSNLIQYQHPVYDIKEDFPQELEMTEEQQQEFSRNFDMEDYISLDRGLIE